MKNEQNRSDPNAREKQNKDKMPELKTKKNQAQNKENGETHF